MNDAFKAFIEFLVDLFNALSKFLGFDFDLGGMINPTAATEDTKENTEGE
ncbi:MAG: hypothetical protein SOX69_00630 [Oscillospiraceae bacterium]|nr:hypothetical protein [Oscillospiraceae bacterium]